MRGKIGLLQDESTFFALFAISFKFAGTTFYSCLHLVNNKKVECVQKQLSSNKRTLIVKDKASDI